ncbi:MAG: LysM peptidoglycan-binding domain-containing protein [Anaerolineales bacterium]|nr:LysM peptidoglycan-binding domain-containing protein [Anaerolineales bacterium]
MWHATLKAALCAATICAARPVLGGAFRGLARFSSPPYWPCSSSGGASARNPANEGANSSDVQAILPTSEPLLEPTATSTVTPTPLPTSTPPPIVTETLLLKHVVEGGESLLSIAIQYGISVEEIQRANGLSTELIRVGDELDIPVVRESGLTSSSGPADNFSYTVEDGDTLISIALKFGSTVEDIQTSNSLAANDLIRPGDLLNIPVRGAPVEALQLRGAPQSTPVPGEDTATPAPNYAEPRLVGPPNNESIVRTDPVMLEWAGLGELRPNEWYVVQVLPRSPQARPSSTAWTKDTRFQLGAELAPGEGERADYDWLVSVVRVIPTGSQAAVEAASPPSEIRRFSWQ